MEYTAEAITGHLAKYAAELQILGGALRDFPGDIDVVPEGLLLGEGNIVRDDVIRVVPENYLMELRRLEQNARRETAP